MKCDIVPVLITLNFMAQVEHGGDHVDVYMRE